MARLQSARRVLRVVRHDRDGDPYRLWNPWAEASAFRTHPPTMIRAAQTPADMPVHLSSRRPGEVCTEVKVCQSCGCRHPAPAPASGHVAVDRLEDRGAGPVRRRRTCGVSSGPDEVRRRRGLGCTLHIGSLVPRSAHESVLGGLTSARVAGDPASRPRGHVRAEEFGQQRSACTGKDDAWPVTVSRGA
jgi:hypothetical protein